jgi:hypothetical protein
MAVIMATFLKCGSFINTITYTKPKLVKTTVFKVVDITQSTHVKAQTKATNPISLHYKT